MGCCASSESTTAAELTGKESLRTPGAFAASAGQQQPAAVPLTALESDLESRGGDGIADELEVLRATTHVCAYFQEQFASRLAAIEDKLRQSPCDQGTERTVADGRRMEQVLLAYMQSMGPRLDRAELKSNCG